jgi:large subunit ribosomal protein L9
MQVILTEAVNKVGNQGEVVNVARGYARNYLIPRGLAIVADTKNIQKLEHHKRILDDRRKREMKEASAMVDRLEELSVEIPVRAGEEDKLYGSVTTSDIAEILKEKHGVDVDRRKIHLEEPIKALGVYTVEIKVAPEQSAHVKVWVVKQKEA